MCTFARVGREGAAGLGWPHASEGERPGQDSPVREGKEGSEGARDWPRPAGRLGGPEPA